MFPLNIKRIRKSRIATNRYLVEFYEGPSNKPLWIYV